MLNICARLFEIPPASGRVLVQLFDTLLWYLTLKNHLDLWPSPRFLHTTRDLIIVNICAKWLEILPTIDSYDSDKHKRADAHTYTEPPL
jgi:hypothetical protein